MNIIKKCVSKSYFPALLLLVIFTGINAIMNHGLTLSFFKFFLLTNAPALCVAIGVSATIIIAGTDISLGSIVSLVNVVIITLAGGSVDYSFAEWYMGNQLGFILTPVALILLLCLIWFVAIKTPFGLKLYALGCDEKKAYASGVKVGAIRFLVHTYAGLAAGIAGICITANTCSGSPTIGASMSLNSIAAAVIGGISLNGGIGTIGGGLLGAAFLSILTNIVVAAKLSSYVQSFVQGLILLIGVILSIVAGDKEIKSKFRGLFRKGVA